MIIEYYDQFQGYYLPSNNDYMKHIFTLVFMGFVMQSQAQTLTYANFSQSLSVTQNIVLGEPNSFNSLMFSATGTGANWVSTGILQKAGTPAIHMIYAAPSSSPYSAIYPAANYVQYDPALTAVIPYNYFSISADSVVSMGNYEASTAHEIFQDPDKSLIFPMAYGQSFTDSYNKTNYSNSSTVSSYQTGTRQVTFVGHGTMNLPQGSFPNVAMMHELRTNSLGPNSNKYSWINMNNGRTLLSYSENNGNITIFYTSDLPAGVNDQDGSKIISLYPNPFTEKAELHFTGLQNNESMFADILNEAGELVQRVELVNGSATIERKTLTVGLYFYRVQGKNEILANGKFVVN